MVSTLNGENEEAEQSSSVRFTRSNNHTRAFQELVNSQEDSRQRQKRWEKQRDESLGPILSHEWVATSRDKKKSGEGISQRVKDCLRLKKADEEWIGEAKKVVSVGNFPSCEKR